MGACCDGLETARDLFDEGVVFEIAGGGKDHVAADEALAVVVEERLLLEAADGLLGAENRLAEGMVLPEILSKDLVDEVVGVVFVHLDLFENDAAFAGDVFGGEDRIEHQVGEDVERRRDVLVENLHVEADRLFAGEGVEVAADGVDLAGDVLGAARFCSL